MHRTLPLVLGPVLLAVLALAGAIPVLALNDGAIDGPVTGDLLVQVSAHGDPVAGRLETDGSESVRVMWGLRRARVAPGQSVVFYDLDDRCVLGGGIAQPG